MFDMNDVIKHGNITCDKCGRVGIETSFYDSRNFNEDQKLEKSKRKYRCVHDAAVQRKKVENMNNLQREKKPYDPKLSNTDRNFWAWREGIKKEEEASRTLSLSKFVGHTDCVTSLALSRNSKGLISSSSDNTIRIWDLNSGVELNRINYYDTNGVFGVNISKSGMYIVSISDDEIVRVWRKGNHMPYHLLGHEDDIYALAISHYSNHVVSGGVDKNIIVWNLSNINSDARFVKKLTGHEACVNALAISYMDLFIVSGSDDKNVCLWNFEGVLRHTFTGHTNSVTTVAISNNVSKVASGSADNTVCVWGVGKKKLLHRLMGHTSQVQSVDFSNDSQYIVSGGMDKTIFVWNAQNGTAIKGFVGHSSFINSVVFSNDDENIYSAGSDNKIKEWSMKEILAF